MSDRDRGVRIVTADDHAAFRIALRELLAADGFEVVGEAADGHEAVDLVRRLAPDLLVLDLLMPRMGGMDALRRLAQDFISVRTVLLTAAVAGQDIATALQLGARGVLLKPAVTELMRRCIASVMAGDIWIGRESVAGLAEALRRVRSPSASVAARVASLTPREREILAAIGGGASNREIAASLALTEQTIRNHLANILAKCGASSRVELAVLAGVQRDGPGAHMS